MSIIQGDIPCWYRLSWDSENSALILSIHKACYDRESFLERVKPFADVLVEKYKFLKFYPELEDGLCFNKVLKYQGIYNNFHKFEISLKNPPLPGREFCEKCLGHEKDLFVIESCSVCNGLGRKLELTYKKLFAISASFQVLLRWLRFFEACSFEKEKQLLVFQVVCGYGPHSSSISGEFSKFLISYLADPLFKLGRNIVCLDFISGEMEKAYWVMRHEGNRVLHSTYFEFEVREHGLVYVRVPGDGCFIHPCSSRFGKNKGYKFTCHNVDSSLQQLTLLVGLACLSDMFRENR